MPGRATSDDLAGIVRPLVGLLARASRRILHDDGLAEDAIQETLLCFWSQRQRPLNPRAWLLHAVTLRSLHLARTRRRCRRHEELACLRRPERSIRDDPADDLDRDEIRQLVNEALGRVSEEHRAVFMLWAFDGQDYEAIAETLRIPIGTVRSRLNRSRKALRQALPASEVCPE